MGFLLSFNSIISTYKWLNHYVTRSEVSLRSVFRTVLVLTGSSTVTWLHINKHITNTAKRKKIKQISYQNLFS